MAFKTTRWSIVLRSRQDDSAKRAKALQELCSTYWQPLYAFARKQGRSTEDAEDLVQGFFSRFLSTDGFAKADPQRGRFRSFLVKSLENYIRNEWAKESAQKRPNPRNAVRIDVSEVEHALGQSFADDTTPEKLYERQWALNILSLAFDDVRAQYERTGRLDRFEQLAPFITAEGSEANYREVSDGLQMNPGAIRVAVHRLRAQYQHAIRERVRDTVASDDDVEQELEYLMNCF